MVINNDYKLNRKEFGNSIGSFKRHIKNKKSNVQEYFSDHYDMMLQPEEKQTNITKYEETMENIQEDLNESANLGALKGSHFRVALRDSIKDLRTKTQLYFGQGTHQTGGGQGQPVNDASQNRKLNQSTNSTSSQSAKTVSAAGGSGSSGKSGVVGANGGVGSYV